jgi:hypothetical protein
METLPAAKEGSADVAKLTIGIAAAVAGVFFPWAGALGPIAAFAIDKYVKGPEKILVDELRRGNFDALTEENAAAFIPMAYKFFEAAKEGEYEHILRVLAELLKNEMRSETPDVSAFARMSRRVQGLTRDELKVVVLINASLTTISMAATDAPTQGDRPYVSAHSLSIDSSNKEHFDRFALKEILSDLAGRGLLVVDGMTRFDKTDEYYFTSSSFEALIEKARDSLSATASGGQ